MPVASPLGTTGWLDVRYLVAPQITSVALFRMDTKESALCCAAAAREGARRSDAARQVRNRLQRLFAVSTFIDVDSAMRHSIFPLIFTEASLAAPKIAPHLERNGAPGSGLRSGDAGIHRWAAAQIRPGRLSVKQWMIDST
jgi:hypothetical protein